MSLLNTVTAINFLKRLTTPFKDMKAFELGIIDENGKLLKKKKERKTKEERESYDTFTRLIVNLKRHLGMVPFLRGRLGSLSAALWLMREEVDLSGDDLVGTFVQYLREERIMSEDNIKDLIEDYYAQYLTEDAPTTSIGAPPGNLAGVSDNDPPGKKKRRKKHKGIDIFEVDTDLLKTAKLSKRSRDSFIKTLDNRVLAKELRQYFKSYPSAPLLLQDKSGVMVRLRR